MSECACRECKVYGTKDCPWYEQTGIDTKRIKELKQENEDLTGIVNEVCDDIQAAASRIEDEYRIEETE